MRDLAEGGRGDATEVGPRGDDLDRAGDDLQALGGELIGVAWR